MDSADGLSAGLLSAHGPPPAVHAAAFSPFAGQGLLKKQPHRDTQELVDEGRT